MDCALSLTYRGSLADRGMLSFYDLAHALSGFERTISITTHLLLNGKVITQSTSAKGFHILVTPPEVGSWKLTALVGVGGTLAAFGTAAPDTQFGWLAKSATEYVIQETLGFTPNFDETLGAQIEKYRASEPRHPISNELSEDRFDSVIEKCEAGIKGLHRPIVFSESAGQATIDFKVAATTGQMDVAIDQETYQYISEVYRAEDIKRYCGIISSYNVNTYRGRIYSHDQERTIPFELSKESRNDPSLRLIGASLNRNVVRQRREEDNANIDICFEVFENTTSTGRVKSLYVVLVRPPF